jgi:adenylate kinase
MPINIIVIGPPGAGKGTQAARVAASWGFHHLCSSDVLRGHATADVELSGRINETMRSGGLVSDELVFGVVREQLMAWDRDAGCVFDGVPRTLNQAARLHALLAECRPTHGLLAVELHVPESEVLRRLQSRRVCPQCGSVPDVHPLVQVCVRCNVRLQRREDDSVEIVLARLRRYRVEVDPLLQYYSKQKLLVRVNGTGEREIVTSSLYKHIVTALRAREAINTLPLH